MYGKKTRKKEEKTKFVSNKYANVSTRPTPEWHMQLYSHKSHVCRCRFCRPPIISTDYLKDCVHSLEYRRLMLELSWNRFGALEVYSFFFGNILFACADCWSRDAQIFLSCARKQIITVCSVDLYYVRCRIFLVFFVAVVGAHSPSLFLAFFFFFLQWANVIERFIFDVNKRWCTFHWITRAARLRPPGSQAVACGIDSCSNDGGDCRRSKAIPHCRASHMTKVQWILFRCLFTEKTAKLIGTS